MSLTLEELRVREKLESSSNLHCSFLLLWAPATLTEESELRGAQQ